MKYLGQDPNVLMNQALRLTNYLMDYPELAIQILNNKYLSKLIYGYMNLGPTSLQIVDNVKPLLVHVIRVIKEGKMNKSLIWPVLRKEALNIEKNMDGKSKEMTELGKELEHVVDIEAKIAQGS